MRDVIRKATSMLIIAALLFSFSAISASAAGPGSVSNDVWDIVLVLDCSASLVGSSGNDREGLRYEAIESLLYSLDADKAEVGAVLFRANDQPGKDLRNGTKSYPIGTIKSAIDKTRLMGNLKNESGLPRHVNAQTDYYTALLVAQEMLHDRNNGRPGAIFLFTDGLLEVMDSDKGKAEQNLETAIQEIQRDGIMLCGVYLNGKGRADSNSNSISVRDIVNMANEGSGRALNDLFVEINNAVQCYEPTDRFLSALGYDMAVDPSHRTITDTTTLRFEFPGIGINKLAIRLTSQNPSAKTQIKNVVSSVTLEDPMGQKLDGSRILNYHGQYRNVYELERTDAENRGMKWAGEWKITIELSKTATVGVDYDPVFISSVDAELATDPAPADLNDLRVRTDLTLTGCLTQAAKEEDYEGYTCVLQLKTPAGEETQTLHYDAALNGFPYTLPLDYGPYEASVSFECALMKLESERLVWTVTNQPPSESAANPLPAVRFSLFNPGSWSQRIDLAKHIEDEDEIGKLTLRLPNGGSAIRLKGTALQLRGLTFGTTRSAYGAESGLVPIEVTDTEGATGRLMLRVDGGGSGLLIPALIVLAVLLLVLLIVIILVIRSIVGSIPDGHCSAEFQIENAKGRPLNVSLSLAAPGTSSEVRRSTTLYNMLHAELSQDVVDGVNPQDLPEVRSFVEDYIPELRKVLVKCASFTTKRGKKKVKITVPLVQYEGRTVKLFNSSVPITIGDTLIDLGYITTDGEETEPFSSFDNDSDWSAPGVSSGNSDEDDNFGF